MNFIIINVMAKISVILLMLHSYCGAEFLHMYNIIRRYVNDGEVLTCMDMHVVHVHICDH